LLQSENFNKEYETRSIETGNEGVEEERSYKAAVITIWPRKFALDIVRQSGLMNSIDCLSSIMDRLECEKPTEEGLARYRSLIRTVILPQREAKEANLPLLKLLCRCSDREAIQTFLQNISQTPRKKFYKYLINDVAIQFGWPVITPFILRTLSKASLLESHKQ